MTNARPLLFAALVVAALAGPVLAFDARQTFTKNAFVLSGEAGFGEQTRLFESHRLRSDFEFWNTGVRLGWLPLGISLDGGPLMGSVELGLEPYYQRYAEPNSADWAGMAATFRYHFLALGRVVPYAEVFVAVGATDLRSREVDSDVAFLLQGGPGLSFFVTDRAAIYGGYRLQHVSNGNTQSPNRGFEAHTGVFGISVFSP